MKAVSLIVVGGFAPWALAAATILGPVMNPANGHLYFLTDDITWQAGESTALALGGHLATINDAAEQDWVFATFGTVDGVERSLWIGLREVGSEGNYEWVSGEPVTYIHWDRGEPNNAPGGESFVHMIRTANGFNNPPGYWNDLKSPNSNYPQFDPFGAVVEVVPPVVSVGRGPAFQYSYSPRPALGLDPNAIYDGVRYNREPPSFLNCSFIIPSTTTNLSRGTVTYVFQADPGFVIRDITTYQKATLYTAGSIQAEFSTNGGFNYTRFFYTPPYGPELTHERGATLRGLFCRNVIIRYTLILTNGNDFNIQFLRDCDDATTALRIDGTVVSQAEADRTVVLIPATAQWKYLDDGSDQQSAWRMSQFDDSAWKIGPAELGYGDTDEATIVSYGSDAGNKHITTYFRHSFTTPVQPFERLTLGLLRDDGAVLYLNGSEILRSNMGGGPINYRTVATANADEETRFYEIALNPIVLRPGMNVLAAEVHQLTAGSSDLSFALELRGALRRPTLRATLSNDCVVLTWIQPGWQLETATRLDGPWSVVPPPNSSPYTVCASAGHAFYRLQKQP